MAEHSKIQKLTKITQFSSSFLHHLYDDSEDDERSDDERSEPKRPSVAPVAKAPASSVAKTKSPSTASSAQPQMPMTSASAARSANAPVTKGSTSSASVVWVRPHIDTSLHRHKIAHSSKPCTAATGSGCASRLAPTLSPPAFNSRTGQPLGSNRSPDWRPTSSTS